MSKPWDNIISEDEQNAYNAAGFGRPTGMGQRPALLIIDASIAPSAPSRGRSGNRSRNFQPPAGMSGGAP